jgi:hypothetical protein
MTAYLAIDPGLTTGVAHYDTRTREFGSLEIEGRHNLYDYLAGDWTLGIEPRAYRVWAEHGIVYPPVLIVEDWTVRGDTHRFTRQDDPHRIIGALDYLAYTHDVPMRLQTPAEAKRFATNDKLRALGWYEGGEGHADDAARHLLVALVKDKVVEILEAIT